MRGRDFIGVEHAGRVGDQVRARVTGAPGLVGDRSAGVRGGRSGSRTARRRRESGKALLPPGHRPADAHDKEDRRVGRVAEGFRAEFHAIRLDHSFSHAALPSSPISRSVGDGDNTSLPRPGERPGFIADEDSRGTHALNGDVRRHTPIPRCAGRGTLGFTPDASVRALVRPRACVGRAPDVCLPGHERPLCLDGSSAGSSTCCRSRDARALVRQRALSAAVGRRAPMTVSPILDSAGRRRSPATMPGYHAGRPPRNKGVRYPADPPTVEEIIAVMRQTGDDRHGFRLRALIIVLWRGGLRVQERARSASVTSTRGAGRCSCVTARAAGAARSAWTPGAGSSYSPGVPPGLSYPPGRCSASSTARPAGGPGRAPTSASNSAGSPPTRVSGAASRPPRIHGQRKIRGRQGPQRDPRPGCHITRISNTPTSAPPAARADDVRHRRPAALSTRSGVSGSTATAPAARRADSCFHQCGRHEDPDRAFLPRLDIVLCDRLAARSRDARSCAEEWGSRGTGGDAVAGRCRRRTADRAAAALGARAGSGWLAVVNVST